MDTNEEERAKVYFREIVAPILIDCFKKKAAAGCIMFSPQRPLLKIFIRIPLAVFPVSSA
jgi:hypothetical protein